MSKELGEQIKQLAAFVADAEILALNCMSPMSHAGCFKFELCKKCDSSKNCLAFIAKKFFEEYKKKGFLI